MTGSGNVQSNFFRGTQRRFPPKYTNKKYILGYPEYFRISRNTFYKAAL